MSTTTNVLSTLPVDGAIAEAVQNLALSREQACKLVMQGTQSIRLGILSYYNLGLGLTDLYADLKEAGWDKSKRTLQRIAAELRDEGLLPETNQGRRSDLVNQQSASDMVSPPKAGASAVMKKSDVHETRLYSVTMVTGLQNREVELLAENESLKAQVASLNDRVAQLQGMLTSNSVLVSA